MNKWEDLDDLEAIKWDIIHWSMNDQAKYADTFCTFLHTDETYLKDELKRCMARSFYGGQVVEWSAQTVANLAYLALYTHDRFRPAFLFEYRRLMNHVLPPIVSNNEFINTNRPVANEQRQSKSG